ncbi:MAG: hypothetical protein QM764_03060 [Chitinophagaceae bacterium]
MGKEAFLQGNLQDIEKVLTETFQRVAYNLEIIYTELKEINYLFNTKPKYNFEKPIHKPLTDTNILLEKLENSIKPFGYVPLSLKYFYKIVGGVNFVWDYNTDENIMWKMADPIQITSLDAITEEGVDDGWREDAIERCSEDEYSGNAVLYLSADDLHKDNVSGGEAYAIEITKKPSVDSKFINEPNNTTFINYLRICFDYCGFPGMAGRNVNNDHKQFLNKVKPLLKPI